MKKIVLFFAILCCSLALISCGSDQSETAKHLEDEFGITSGYHSNAESDWLVTSTSNPSANDPRDWALECYNEYGTDAKIVWVVNFANNTTTQIRNDSANGLLLHVLQMDGAKDVESSLNKGEIYSGTTLSEFYIFEEDGETKIEEID